MPGFIPTTKHLFCQLRPVLVNKSLPTAQQQIKLAVILFACVFVSSLSNTVLAQSKFPHHAPRDYTVPANFMSHVLRGPDCTGFNQAFQKSVQTLKREGHRVVLVMKNGAPYPMPKHRLPDIRLGKRVQDLPTLSKNLDSEASSVALYRSESKHDIIKSCLHNRNLHRGAMSDCAIQDPLQYTHVGILMLQDRDNDFKTGPYIAHYYGDEVYDYTRGSLRFERPERYVRDKDMSQCRVGLAIPQPEVQDRIAETLKNEPLISNLTSTAPMSYNFISRAWNLFDQNCVEWVADVIGSVLSKAGVAQNRVQAKARLWELGYAPSYYSLGTLLYNGGQIGEFLSNKLRLTPENFDRENGILAVPDAGSILRFMRATQLTDGRSLLMDVREIR